MADGIAQQIMKFSFLSIANAEALTEAVNSSGYTVEGKEKLQNVIDLHLEQSLATAEPIRKKGFRFQYLHSPMTNYLTSAEGVVDAMHFLR